jgi:hypothetical protein
MRQGQFRAHMLPSMGRLVKGANLDQASDTVSRAMIRHRKSGTGQRALLQRSLASTEEIPKVTGAAASGAASVRGNAGRSRALRLTPDCDGLAALRLLAKQLIRPAVIDPEVVSQPPAMDRATRLGTLAGGVAAIILIIAASEQAVICPCGLGLWSEVIHATDCLP